MVDILRTFFVTTNIWSYPALNSRFGWVFVTMHSSIGVNHPPKYEDVKLVRVSKVDQNNRAKSWKHTSINPKPSSTNVERPADLPRALLQRRSRRRSGRHARRIKRLVPPPHSSLHEITRKLTFCWARDSVTVAHARSTCTRQACHTAPPHNCHPQLYSWQSTVLTYFIICGPPLTLQLTWDTSMRYSVTNGLNRSVLLFLLLGAFLT